MKVDTLSFNVVLLLERVQISWLPQTKPSLQRNLGVALQGNPSVEWYVRHKCPEIGPWLDRMMSELEPPATGSELRSAEIAVMEGINDWLVYAVDPSLYDDQSFLRWDSRELTSLVDFREATVIDVGAGTGRLTLTAAPTAHAVFAVEPIESLRRYLAVKARGMGYGNVYTIDGLAEDIHLPDETGDVTISGHVFGADPEAEHREMCRVTRPGGMIIHCPGTSAASQAGAHDFLVAAGYEWSIFEEPDSEPVRKYWKRV